MTQKFGIHPDTGRWNLLHAQQFKPEMIQRIMETYKGATKEQLEEGMHWYEKAHDIASKMAPGNVEKGAGIIAALSPQTGWGRNLMLAGQMIQTGTTRHTTDSLQKAERILQGEKPLDVLRGQKVTSFYKNIVDPSEPHTVTIDRHAHDIAVGVPFRGPKKSDEPSPDLGLGEKGRYDFIADVNREASERLGIPIANKTQSTTWVVHRGRHD